MPEYKLRYKGKYQNKSITIPNIEWYAYIHEKYPDYRDKKKVKDDLEKSIIL